MKTHKQTKEFKTLQSKWYKILKESGFSDIENSKHQLKSESWGNKETYAPARQEWHASKAEYFQLATTFLNNYKFESILEQVIWEYHTNGINIRKIAETLQKAKVSTLKKSAVFNIVARLRNKMKELYVNG